MLRYFAETGRPLHRDSLAAGWGACQRFVEIGDDRHATRQIEDYGKGRVLRYDRSHWCDQFGQLFGCLFSRKPKAIKIRSGAEVIDRQTFERVWRAALGSQVWPQQVKHSRAADWGAVPSWLRAAAEPGPAPGPAATQVSETSERQMR